MPCGGIAPISNTEDITGDASCFFCGQEIEKKEILYCEEWDCFLHRDCVLGFLKTEEGQIVLRHGHQVILYWESEEPIAEPEQ